MCLFQVLYHRFSKLCSYYNLWLTSTSTDLQPATVSPQDLVYDRRQQRRLGPRRIKEETLKKKAKLVSFDDAAAAAAAALMLYINSAEVNQVLPFNIRVVADVVDADADDGVDDDCNSSTCQLDIDILIITSDLSNRSPSG